MYNEFVFRSTTEVILTLDMLSFGIAVYSTIIVVVNVRLLIHAKFWNVVLVSMVTLSILVYFGFT